MAEDDEWSEIEVFADRLQAAGDPRGELLAVEMAAERATSSDEARRLNREAQRIRDAHHELVWPSVLADTRAQMRAGFVVAGDWRELAKPAIPLELLLGMLHLTAGERLEDCVPWLDEAQRRGLRLWGLSSWGERSDPTKLDCLRRFVELDAHAPSLQYILLGAPVSEVRVLTGLTRLRSCWFWAPLAEAEQRSLALLRLDSLGVHGTLLPELVALFGDTLESLDLTDWTGSLAPLASLSKLRSLSLRGEITLNAVAELSGLVQLETLGLPSVDEAGLTALAGLRLRHLTIHAMPARLVDRLPLLQGLESLHIYKIEDGPLDVSPLVELAQLRRLSLDGEMIGDLQLRPGFERLLIDNVHTRAPISGEVSDLSVYDSDLRCLPASLLESVRELSVTLYRPDDVQALAELPRLMPRLEQLELEIDLERNPDEAWDEARSERIRSEALQLLDALPQLRKLELGECTVHELAERARRWPDLCVLGHDSWPRSCGSA